MNNQEKPQEKPVRQRNFFIVDDKDNTKEVFQAVKQRIINQHPMLDTMTDAFFMRTIMKSLADCSDAAFKRIINV